ncbi:MAG: DUF3883 domain-containing protein [Anaerolineae bacterium]
MKLDRIRAALGTDRVFDIIGDVIPGTNLSDLLKDAIFNQRRMEEIEAQIDQVDEQYAQQTMERMFMTGLATRHQDTAQYAAFTDPEGKREGALWFVEGVVRDGTGAAAGRRVFCVLQAPDGSLQTLNPAVLWDLDPAPEAEVPPATAERMADRDAIEDHIVEHILFPYRDEMAARRQHDAEIKERYGLRSLDHLIQESNQKLLEYELRADAGQSMDIVIRNERRNLEQLQQRRAELETEIRLERNLTIDEPKIIGVAAVIPQPEPVISDEPGEMRRVVETPGEYVAGGMARDEEIERVGMEVATAYEEARGWRVEDVSQEIHGGFDLRSMCFDEEGMLAGIRYIEVKARALSGAIRLTSNEWKKARHFGEDYWIYVVTNAGSDSPELTRIRNPAARFREGEDIFATGFMVREEDWRRHGE